MTKQQITIVQNYLDKKAKAVRQTATKAGDYTLLNNITWLYDEVTHEKN
jgi:hypothetical protein